MKKSIFLICLTMSQARASAEPLNVLFFGGYRASYDQMRCWEQGARAQVSANEVVFRAFSYPKGASSSSASAVAFAKEKITRLVKEIDAHPNRRYVIVGHSSGAAISNRVAELVRIQPSRLKLVALDGFTPSASLQRRVSSSCHWAINPQTGLLSRNASAMKSTCANHPKWEQPTCLTAWCLHFSLVNTSVPRNLSLDYPSNGYNGCSANLDFLKVAGFDRH